MQTFLEFVNEQIINVVNEQAVNEQENLDEALFGRGPEAVYEGKTSTLAEFIDHLIAIDDKHKDDCENDETLNIDIPMWYMREKNPLSLYILKSIDKGGDYYAGLLGLDTEQYDFKTFYNRDTDKVANLQGSTVAGFRKMIEGNRAFGEVILNSNGFRYTNIITLLEDKGIIHPAMFTSLKKPVGYKMVRYKHGYTISLYNKKENKNTQKYIIIT